MITIITGKRGSGKSTLVKKEKNCWGGDKKASNLGGQQYALKWGRFGHQNMESKLILNLSLLTR